MSRVSANGVEFVSVAQGFYLEALLVEGGDIWFSDVVLGGVRNTATDQVLLPERMMIGGLVMNHDGSLLVSGAGGIGWADPATGRAGTLLSDLDGVNEMRADGRGGMFFGTIDLGPILRGERPGPSALCHVAGDRRVTRLWDGLTFANGLSPSPDGGTLYFSESFSAVRAFPLNADGTVSAPRTLIDMYDCDGMALDAEGNIWVTGFGSDFLRCVRPDGSEVRRLALPGAAATNLRFGGDDMRDLYITVVDPRAAQALAEGRPLEERNSAIFRTRSPVPGAPLAKTGFQLQHEGATALEQERG